MGSKWFIHDPERPQPRAVEPGPSSTLGAKPPEGAVILFDGTDPSGWTGGPWRVADGYMEVNGTGDITSKAVFGDGRLHVNGGKLDRGSSRGIARLIGAKKSTVHTAVAGLIAAGVVVKAGSALMLAA